MKKNIKKKLYIRKSGWLVEYPHFNKDFIKYLFVRFFSFALDFIIFLALQWVLQIVIGFSWISSAGISYFAFLIYNSLLLLLFDGVTLGLKAGKLIIIQKDITTKHIGKLLMRSSITSLFAMSYIGYAMMLANAIAVIFSRGLGINDVISKTQVVSEHYGNYLKTIESDYVR